MKQIIKNKKLTKSSKNWLQRQMNDQYVSKAKALGYRSRAAFKIIEINNKYKIFNRDSIVIDLGAAPGGWSQIAAQQVKKVIAIDLLEMESITNVNFITGDFLNCYDVLCDMLHGLKANVVMSDMAPNTCGIKKVDHIRIMNLVESVYDFCTTNLAPNGCMIAKVFQGGADSNFLKIIKNSFKKISHFKPQSSRKESAEMYIVCLGYKDKHQ